MSDLIHEHSKNESDMFTLIVKCITLRNEEDCNI
jgi:hypothetical protein